MDAASGYGQHFSLKVLVLPVVPIRKSEFAKHLELLKQHSRIALADIPPPPSGTSSILSTLLPTPVSRGFLNLSFVTEWDQSQGWLEEFQIHRKVHAVLGILDCTEWQDESIGEGLHDGARRFQELVAQMAPRDVSARRCYAFNPGEAHKDNTEGMVIIPNVGDLGFYLGTLLAELASGILAGLSRAVGASICFVAHYLHTILSSDGFARFTLVHRHSQRTAGHVECCGRSKSRSTSVTGE